MPTPTETVNAFLDMWAQPDGFVRAVEAFFTDATVWENHGLATTTGAGEAIGFFRAFGEQAGITAMTVETLALAANGDKVLTERIDTMIGADGKPMLPLRVMGIFEISGGKIAAWRDYFDTKALSPG